MNEIALYVEVVLATAVVAEHLIGGTLSRRRAKIDAARERSLLRGALVLTDRPD